MPKSLQTLSPKLQAPHSVGFEAAAEGCDSCSKLVAEEHHDCSSKTYLVGLTEAELAGVAA